MANTSRARATKRPRKSVVRIIIVFYGLSSSAREALQADGGRASLGGML
jgi:hypothetical protein